MAEVSYLLTSYNKAAYLPCVLESIRRERGQTGGRIVIIDDGSTDGSAELCRAFASANPDTMLIGQKNRGVYASLNRILPLAEAPWIRLCDSDDPLIPGSTRHLVEIGERDGAAIAYGGATNYGPEPLPAEALDVPPPCRRSSFVHPDAILHLIETMDFTTSRGVYRTEPALYALPLPENLISCQDFALALRMTAHGKLVRLPDPVCFYLSGAANQLSASHALTRHQTIRILQASRALLQKRHRHAALTVSYKWCRRELRRQHAGPAFQLRKAALKAVSAAAKLGFYDWSRALDVFAAPFELQIDGVVHGRAAPF
jgi:GT2 family glycosyltransferase